MYHLRYGAHYDNPHIPLNIKQLVFFAEVEFYCN